MKKILFLLGVVSIFAITNVCFAVEVYVSDASGYPGQKDVPVSIIVTGQNPNITGIDLQLQYSAADLEVASVEKGSLISDWNMTSNTKIPGMVTIALYGAQALAAQEGSIAQIKFNVKDAANPEAISALTITTAKFNEKPAEMVHKGMFGITQLASLESQPTQQEQLNVEASTQPQAEGSQTQSGAKIYYSTAALKENLAPAALNSQNLEIMPQQAYNPESRQPEQMRAAQMPQELVALPLPLPQQPAQPQPPIKAAIPQQATSVPVANPAKSTNVSYPALKLIKVKDVLGLWKVYKLEVGGESDGSIKVKSWELAEGQNLPGMLVLNKKEGTIYGLLLFGQTKQNLMVILIVESGTRIKLSSQVNFN